jgi:acyl carrier protein
MPRRLLATLLLASLCGCDPHASHQLPPPAAPVPKGTITERVTYLVAAQRNVPPQKVDADTRLNDDLGFDELDRVELVMELEDEFGIAIDDETASSVKTVGEVIHAVSRLTRKGRQTSDGIPIRPPSDQ